MTSTTKANGRGSTIWIAGVVLVVIIGIIALVAARGSKQEEAAQVDAQQTAPVEVSGADALPAVPQDPAEADPAVGLPVPALSGSSFDGSAVDIDPADGTAKVVIFAAHWCPHCQRELPMLADHLVRSPMPDDVELYTVSTAVAEERGNYPPSTWLEDIRWKAPVLADSAEGDAAKAYALPGFPDFVAVDADGKVVARTSGEISTDAFDALVQAARSGTAPA